jgi:two-component system sensor histidine kinase RegB
VTIAIRDDGPGFPPEIQSQIGEPFVTRRVDGAKRGGGLGLGLFIAKTLLERSGAKVRFENAIPPASGAIVTVTWPRSALDAGRDKGDVSGGDRRPI